MNEPDVPSRHELTVAAVAVVIGALILARNVDARLVGLVLVAPVFLVARVVLVRRATIAAVFAALRSSWGNPVERPRDLKALRRLFVECDGASRSRAALDDATWDDLDLDRVFARLDGTLSAPGEYVLYEMLRTPELDPDVLVAREGALAAVAAAPELREHLRDRLAALGRTPLDPLTELLFGTRPGEDADRTLLALRGALPVIFVVGAVLGLGGTGVLLALVALVMNATTHFRLKNEIALAADGMRYLSDVVRTGARLGAMRREPAAAGLDPLLDAIAQAAQEADVIGKKGGKLGLSERGGGADVLWTLYEYVSIVFLLEVRHYHAVAEHLDAHVAELRRLFRHIGELDALVSTASWRVGNDAFCRPEFVREKTTLEIVDGVHPLLDEPVPNSIALGPRSVVVTGSNMAGKSTCLRMIGLSAILAQTLHTVPAKAYVACPLRVASSISIHDDIVTGRSFYLAEAERLLRLVRAAEEEGPALILVDEPLRGTNSTERTAAVSEILLHLAAIGALTVVATHELRIADLVKTKYDARHLGDEVATDGLRFPHRLLPGVATSRNAIHLLGTIGYPKDLVAAAEALAAFLDGATEA